MYTPPHYKESSFELIHKLIEDNGFATLLTEGEGSLISHLPMILERTDDGDFEILSHMARANPHWKELLKAGKAKVIFQGPHAYISPTWYHPSPENVPTWNYAVVHVMGHFEMIEDQSTVLKIMDKLVTKFESSYETDWSIPRDNSTIEKLMGGITVFRLKNLEFNGKFKLSQKQDSENRNNVIEQLKRLETNNSIALAEYMEKTRE